MKTLSILLNLIGLITIILGVFIINHQELIILGLLIIAIATGIFYKTKKMER